jgi:PRTRC genetic system ThiF family protein
MRIDTSFARAALVLPREHSVIKFYLVGAGGTGSFAAQALARLCYELKEQGKVVELTVIDPDSVEAGNIPRSNFCRAEIGRFKAQTLAERLSAAWGLEIGYSNEKLDYEKHIKSAGGGYRQMTVFVGCVDNHLARREIHRCLKEFEPYNPQDAPLAWWIDGGNGKFSGQVLIGSTVKKAFVEDHFTTASICRKLPAPSLLHPELLENQEHALRRTAAPSPATERASCPELVRLGEQSLNVNSRVAIEIGEMLTQFLLMNSLKRFAHYFDLESGTSRSLYCTPEILEKALKEAADNQPKTRKAKSQRSGK